MGDGLFLVWSIVYGDVLKPIGVGRAVSQHELVCRPLAVLAVGQFADTERSNAS